MHSNSNELNVVFGASGNLGRAVVRELVKRDKPVRAVDRHGRGHDQLGVEIVKGDAADPSSTRKVCAGATVVYNCANPPYTHWSELFPPIQEGIVEGASAAGAILVSAENTYMYGEVEGPMTEDLPYNAHTRKGAVRAQMARDLIAAYESGRVQVTIGRAADFYGPGILSSNIGERVFWPALVGEKASLIGSLDIPRDYIFVDDFAKGLVTLGTHEEALGGVWHIPSAPTLTQHELITLIYEKAGHKPTMSAMPGIMVKGLGLFNPIMREMAEMLYEYEKAI